MKNKKIEMITQAGLIAAIYVVLTVVFAPFGFGEVQVRIAEMLTILPFFSFAAVPGVFVGCLLGNILGGGALPDIIFGSLTTLLAAVFTYLIGRGHREGTLKNDGDIRRRLIIATVPSILLNALIIPFILKYAYGVPMPIPFMMLTVGMGEVISCGLLGTVLGVLIHRRNLLS